MKCSNFYSVFPLFQNRSSLWIRSKIMLMIKSSDISQELDILSIAVMSTKSFQYVSPLEISQKKPSSTTSIKHSFNYFTL